MTALSICQTVASWVGLPVPSALFSTTDAQSVQLRSLLNEEQTELVKWGDTQWRKLTRIGNFTTAAADVQPNAIPTDLDHFIPASMWDRTSSRPVIGPIDEQTWQAWKARPVLTSIIFGFIMHGNDLLMAPNPPAGDSIYFSYISNLGVYAQGDATPTKQYFTADSDTSVFDETMMARGVRWRFLNAKGLPYAQQYQEWVEQVQREAGRTKSAPILNASGPYWTDLLGPYVPSGNWPGTV